MDREPTSWKELVDAPELPENFEGVIISSKNYDGLYDSDEQQIPIIPRVIKTKLGEEECKWYISNGTASCLQSAGYRQTALMPMEAKRSPNHFCYFYGYEVTKRYADWFFEKKGKFNFQKRVVYHMILMFFCEDKNWKPFHHELMHEHPWTVELLKPSSFSVSDITKKIFGCGEIETNVESYTKEEIAFMRALIALSLVYRTEFQQQTDYNNFVKTQVDAFNKITNYGISFESFLNKADFNQFYKLSFYQFPMIRRLIYGYFFALNNEEGDFIRNAIKGFQTVSSFNLIYRFLQIEDKREVHFDDLILKEVEEYIKIIKKFSRHFGERLPYAELIGSYTNQENWKNLAGLAYLYTVGIYPWSKPSNHGEFLKKLEICIPNVEEKLKTVSNEQPNEIYKQFENMQDVHKYMKNIPWDESILNTKYAYFLYKQFIDDVFY